jgi:hypothetical protein
MAVPQGALRPIAPITLDEQIRVVFGREGNKAVAVSHCENPDRGEGQRSSTGRYAGQFQMEVRGLHSDLYRSLGYTDQQVADLNWPNIVAAKRLRDVSGWGAWPVCGRRR